MALSLDQLIAADADFTSVSLRRPIDRGYLINPDVQREIWDRVFRSLLRADPSSSSLLLVEALFNPLLSSALPTNSSSRTWAFDPSSLLTLHRLCNLYETSLAAVGWVCCESAVQLSGRLRLLFYPRRTCGAKFHLELWD
ncbi:hypothetical protein HPP92_009625 [Vanilla planifolia]|uniref:Uncharacterized protein n=1 Tax=Vanilla planifolia TaxID=51239 RepID=A0A835RG62_VANPL|nr:hypothetical protein HPP92_009625 [Vanilla planifolia]